MATGTRDEEKPGLPSQRLKDALTHPVRAQMYEELRKRALGVAELAAIFGKPERWIEYHHRVLREMGGIPTPDAADS